MTSNFWKTRLHVSDPEYDKLIEQIPDISGGLSILEVTIHLYDALRYIINWNISGDVLNFGVFQGWSMYFIASVLDHFNQKHRQVLGFDTLKGFQRGYS